MNEFDEPEGLISISRRLDLADDSDECSSIFSDLYEKYSKGIDLQTHSKPAANGHSNSHDDLLCEFISDSMPEKPEKADTFAMTPTEDIPFDKFLESLQQRDIGVLQQLKKV